MEENFAKAASYIESAAKQGSHLAVLPEFHLTSWVPEDSEFAEYCAKSMAYLPRYQDLARRLNIHIVPGTLVKPVEPENSILQDNPKEVKSTSTEPVKELHNLAYFIAASSGDILFTYQKRNLWHCERGVLTPGLTSPQKAFDVPLPGNRTIRVGMLICWDLAFPEAFRELVVDGAQLIVIASHWDITNIDPEVLALNKDSEVAFLENVTVARAYENTCAVAFCNSFGLSQVAMPILGSLGKLGVEEEGMLIRKVDLETARFAEEYYKVRADYQGEKWHYPRFPYRSTQSTSLAEAVISSGAEV